MLRFVRRSLLAQVLGVYLLFVTAVLATGWAVNTIVQQQLQTNVQAADLALAQAIALQTDIELHDAEQSLGALGGLAAASGDSAVMNSAFQAFKAGRPDVDRVYWINATGIMQVSVPADVRTQGSDVSNQPFYRQAIAAPGPVLQAGIVDLTTFNAVVVIAQAVRDSGGQLCGVVATNLLLDDLSVPLRTVVEEQARQGQALQISMIDDRGQLIATPERERLLQPVLDDLPGAAQALAGQPMTQVAAGPGNKSWLFSAVAMPSSGWAVVVQRPADAALAVVRNFTFWLSLAACFFALGGLLFWLVLMRRVITPLHTLAGEHQALAVDGSPKARSAALTQRLDEVGALARSLQRLEHDVTNQLAELHTLLETSSVVVGTLDPGTVVGSIIREVQRLVDVQAAVMLVPGADGVLRVLASEGRSAEFVRTARVQPDDPDAPSAVALRERRPVQLIAGQGRAIPLPAFAEGFGSILAIPILGPHAGGMALVVYRTRPEAFDPGEVDLLLTFANYAALAWEHAVLYERSDERLRQVAHENERLYREAMGEKQTLAAIMGSMSDGLVLGSLDGHILYANRGAAAIVGQPVGSLERGRLDTIHAALRVVAMHPERYDADLARAEAGVASSWLIETGAGHDYRAIQLRLFAVRDDAGEPIGRGLLLHDVTPEREIDQFKTALLAAVGHELRTPLAAIKGYASTLLQSDVTWSPDEQQHFLQTISDEADRLAQMVSNLLDLSRSEAGLLPLHRTPVRLADLVARVVERLKAPAGRIRVQIPADLPLIEVDGSRIEVVLANLLANALAYADGMVSVTAATADGMVGVRVADDGPGMAPEEVRHAFERFYRAPHGWERRAGGTGLGLAISKAFVEAHGGRIAVQSDSRGTIFSFSLPAAWHGAAAEHATRALGPGHR